MVVVELREAKGKEQIWGLAGHTDDVAFIQSEMGKQQRIRAEESHHLISSSLFNI